MQAQTRKQRGGKLDKKINDAIEMKWKQWGRYDSVSANGRDCFADIELIIAKQLFEAGEIFVRLIKKPFGRSSIPLALELLEPEQLDNDYNGGTRSKNNTWRLGIERDGFNRPVRYAFFKKHPGDTPFPVPVNTKQHMLINADEIIHLFVTDRASQTRGISMLAPALEAMHQLDGYQQSQLIRSRASSALMGFISTTSDDGLVGDDVYENERVTDFQPGTFKYLNSNERVDIPNLDAPNNEFEPFNRIILRSLASGCGVSYESVSKDFSQTNYSSSRLSLLEDRDHYKMIQKYLEERFLQPLFDLWLDLAVLSGNLDLNGYDLDPDKYRRVRWLFRGWAWVDPQKEVNASVIAIKAGLKTQSQVISEMGGDIEELLPARKNEVEQAEQLGLFFDTILTDTSKQQTGTNIESNDTDTNGKET
jgi:lambda family phage portal protein